jgi:hypothetical protein
MPQVEQFKSDALIDIQVSPTFVEGLHGLLLWMVQNQDPTVVSKANERIATGQELEEWDHHYATVLSLISDIEDEARKQGKVVLIEVPDSESTV